MNSLRRWKDIRVKKDETICVKDGGVTYSSAAAASFAHAVGRHYTYHTLRACNPSHNLPIGGVYSEA